MYALHLDCGHKNTRAHSFIGPATTVEGKTMCDKCAHERILADLTSSYMLNKPFCAYIGSGDTQLQTFTGDVLGKVTSVREVRKYAWSTVYAYTVVDVHGRKWHGRGQGSGMCITLKRAKVG